MILADHTINVTYVTLRLPSFTKKHLSSELSKTCAPKIVFTVLLLNSKSFHFSIKVEQKNSTVPC